MCPIKMQILKFYFKCISLDLPELWGLPALIFYYYYIPIYFFLFSLYTNILGKFNP